MIRWPLHQNNRWWWKYDDDGGGDYRNEGDDEYDTNAKNNILALDDYDRNLSYLLDDQVCDDWIWMNQ